MASSGWPAGAREKGEPWRAPCAPQRSLPAPPFHQEPRRHRPFCAPPPQDRRCHSLLRIHFDWAHVELNLLLYSGRVYAALEHTTLFKDIAQIEHIPLLKDITE